jgi:glycosyltransferase involved in cell wall biosynthesis
MRIVFVTQWFDPEPGAIRGLPLARWLQERGHEVRVITGVPNYPGGKVYPGYRIRLWQWEQMSGVPVLRVPLYPNHGQSAVGRIANYTSFAISAATVGLALIGSADVAYVYHPPATVALPAVALKLLRGLPYVYHIADMWPESVVESGMLGRRGTRIVEHALSGWCKFAYRHATTVTVLSPGFKRLLLERGVPADKIEIVYNWTEEDVFRPVPRDPVLAAKLGLENGFNVIYAGNFGSFQGLESVIRAAVRLKQHPEIRIVFAGTGQKENELKQLAAGCGATNVRFIPPRPFREMAAINALADVLLVHLKDLPFFASTIPSKTQVALCSARPVLMAVRGDAAEVIRNAKAGLACEPGNESAIADAILVLFRMSEAERRQLGEAGREFYLREMSLSVGGTAMERIFARMIERQGVAAASPAAQ